jgi:hypothetical protein
VRREPQEDDQERDPEQDADDALGSEQVVYRSHGKLVSVYSHRVKFTVTPRLRGRPGNQGEEGVIGSTYNADPLFPSDPRECPGPR